MSESPPATSESAGEGVAVTGARMSRAVSVTQTPHTYGIGWGESSKLVPGCRSLGLFTHTVSVHSQRLGIEHDAVSNGNWMHTTAEPAVPTHL